jgi:hypothetical protein
MGGTYLKYDKKMEVFVISPSLRLSIPQQRMALHIMEAASLSKRILQKLSAIHPSDGLICQVQ